MVRQFLADEGYADLPVPNSADDLMAFLRPEEGCHPNLFADPGYAHAPVRISFPKRDRRRRKLVVSLYNEAAPDYLLRFHRRQCPRREERIKAAISEQHLEEFGAYM